MSSKPKIKTPYAKLLPPLSADEFAALKASCKDGIRDPVLVDEDGNVLDGHHRLKIDPHAPRKVVPGLTTDAEKKAFIYQINNARRSLTPQQKQELAAEQSEVAVALRKQNPKKFTEKVIAAMMGVSQSTISRMLAKGGDTNMHVHNGIPPSPDARRKVPESDRSTVADRVKKGESKKKIAKSLGVTPRAVTKIAESVNQKAGGKKSAADPNAVISEAQQVPHKQHPVDEASAVPAAVLPGHEEEPLLATPFDGAIAEVQAMLENLKPCDELTRKIASLVPGAIDVENNVNSATNLTQRFAKALKKLEVKAAEFHEQPADGESVQDDDADPDDEEDEPDFGRPSGRVPGKVA